MAQQTVFQQRQAQQPEQQPEPSSFMNDLAQLIDDPRPLVYELVGTTILATVAMGMTVLAAVAVAAVDLAPAADRPFLRVIVTLLMRVVAGAIVAAALGFLVSGLGRISGGQLNPAVTVSLLAAGQISVVKAGAFIGCQIVGGLIANVATRLFFGTLPSFASASAPLEALGAGILCFAVVLISKKAVPEAGSGPAVFFALWVALSLTGGICNPAIATGMVLILTGATLGPIVAGAVVGFAMRRATPKDNERKVA